MNKPIGYLLKQGSSTPRIVTPRQLASLPELCLLSVQQLALDSYRNIEPNPKVKAEYPDCHKIEIKGTINLMCSNHPETIPSPTPV